MLQGFGITFTSECATCLGTVRSASSHHCSCEVKWENNGNVTSTTAVEIQGRKPIGFRLNGDYNKRNAAITGKEKKRK